MDNRRFVANLLEVSPNSLKELPDYAIAKIVELYGKASGDVLPAGWEVSHPLLSLEKFNGLPATRGPLVGTRFIYDLTAPVPCSMFKLLTPVEIAHVGGRAVTVAKAFTHPSYSLILSMYECGVIRPAEFGVTKQSLLRSMRTVDAIRLFAAWLIHQGVPVAFFPYIEDVPAAVAALTKREHVKQIVRTAVTFYAPKIRRLKSLDGTDLISYLYTQPLPAILRLVNDLGRDHQGGVAAYDIFKTHIERFCNPLFRYAPLWDPEISAEEKFHLTMTAAHEFGLHFNTQLHIRDVQPTSIHAEELIASLNTEDKFKAMLKEFEENSI